MGDGPTQTTTQSSGLNNAAMNTAVTTIGNQLNTQLGKGFKGYKGDLNPAMSSQTQAGIGALTKNPNNSIFSSGVSGTLGQQAQIARGNFGADPLRQRIMDDVSAQTNSVFNASGRFGGGSNQEAMTENLVGALAPYDYGRQQQAIGNMGALYSMSNMPASANLQAGQIQDAYNTAEAQEAMRRFNVDNNQGWLTLNQAGSILGTTAPAAGTTGSTTQSQQLPWWQVPAQIGGTVLGAMF